MIYQVKMIEVLDCSIDIYEVGYYSIDYLFEEIKNVCVNVLVYGFDQIGCLILVVMLMMLVIL